MSVVITIISATPNGGSLVDRGNSTAASSAPSSLNAFAGNITEVDVTGNTVTQAWQGYYGNVSGAIVLANSAGNQMYNWSGTAAAGEVYASNESSILWNTIECFNMTGDGLNINVTELEDTFNIGNSDGDGIDETFNLNNHALFTTAGNTFTAGECNNTKVFGSSGAATYDEVMLYEPARNRTVFASIINDDAGGFNGNTYDFEMLVPEDGHGTDTNPTLYYFYIEIG